MGLTEDALAEARRRTAEWANHPELKEHAEASQLGFLSGARWALTRLPEPTDDQLRNIARNATGTGYYSGGVKALRAVWNAARRHDA